MSEEESKPEIYFECSHCKASGGTNYSLLEREQQDTCVKVWLKNLPKGLSEKGIKNLFLTVGSPIYISFNPANNSALVTFESLKEAELAVRDLNCQPPYNLKVTIASQKFQNKACLHKEDNDSNPKVSDSWDFSVPQKTAQPEGEDESKKVSEIITEIRHLGSLGYDPSIRMRQKMLDFKTSCACVSMGRGYLNMGKDDRFVGGLQKCVLASGNSKAKEKLNFYCENCKAPTTKFCGNCYAYYCSKICLRNSDIDHEYCSVDKNGEVKGFLEQRTSKNCEIFPQVPFTSGCTVVMSSYCTMKKVFVRRSDGPWGERFVRLCNAVAAEAIKGRRLEKTPEEGDVIAAKYHEDLCFYRARVLSKTDTKILVSFIDFGNTQETDVEDLRCLPDNLKSVPGYACQVQLKDVSEDSSLDSVDYFNKLTAKETSLILNFENSTDEVVLVEEDSTAVVNQIVTQIALPPWKKSGFTFSKSEEIYYLDSIKRKKLEIMKKYSLVISHFEEKEFSECDVFWVTHPDADDFFHVKSKMRLEMMEYCQLLKGESYLPRDNELCLAKENDLWHRCVNLQSHKTTCCLFFLDDGHSSFIETKHIRKMIQDFTEAPCQAVCCVLPDDPKLKTDKELRPKVIKYLQESVGQRIDSVCVLKLMGDAYCLSIPRVKEILTGFEP